MSWYEAANAPKTMTAMLEITKHDAGCWKNHQSPVTITMFVRFLKTVTCAHRNKKEPPPCRAFRKQKRSSVRKNKNASQASRYLTTT